MVLINKLEKVIPDLTNKTISVLGLTFKPNTDDLREAPSIENIKYLLKQGATIKAFDPIGINNFKRILSNDKTLHDYLDNITYYDNIDDTIKGSDACLIMTEWKDIKEYPLINYEKLMNSPIIFDGRNCYDLDNVKKYNIYYDKIFFVNAKNSHSKTEVCLENNISIMIDDSKRLCLDMIKHGITTFIIDTPYNKDVDGSVRVHNWKEIYENIKKYSNRMNVILDTDIYNEADDQFALSYLLKSRDMFNIEAITTAPYLHKNSDLTVKEGQDLSYNEVLKICNLLNFNFENKVFKGSIDYIQNGYDDENDAVNKIIEIALKNDMTYVLSIGAITNIALAIKKEPKIINKIEIIWLGGNDISYKDNMEYNFRQDVEAVKIVFNSNAKLTVLSCKNVVSILKIDISTLKNNLTQNKFNNYLIGLSNDKFRIEGINCILHNSMKGEL